MSRRPEIWLSAVITGSVLLVACAPVKRPAAPPAAAIAVQPRQPTYVVSLQVAGAARMKESGEPLRDEGGYLWFEPCVFNVEVEQIPGGLPFTATVDINPDAFPGTDVQLTPPAPALTSADSARAHPIAQLSLADRTGGGLLQPCTHLPADLQRYIARYRELRRGLEDTREILDAKEAQVGGPPKHIHALRDAVRESAGRVWELKHAQASHAKIEAAQDQLDEDQRHLKAALGSVPNQTKLLDELAALRREVAARQEQLTNYRFVLGPSRAHVDIGAQLIAGDPDATPWLTVQVKEL